MFNLDIGSFHHVDATAAVLVLFDHPTVLPSVPTLSATSITPQVLSCATWALPQHFNNYNTPTCYPPA